MSAAARKQEVRDAVRRAVLALGPGERRAAAERVVGRVVALPEWRAAGMVLLTAPLPDEIPVDDLLRRALEAGKGVGLPAWDAASGAYGVRRITDPGRDLVAGRFGVREPRGDLPVVPVGGLDLAIVPGIAFSPEGGRIGRGKGFYDRLLAPFRGTACGVAFDQQLVPEVPVEPHDVWLNLVVTPSGEHRPGSPR